MNNSIIIKTPQLCRERGDLVSNNPYLVYFCADITRVLDVIRYPVVICAAASMMTPEAKQIRVVRSSEVSHYWSVVGHPTKTFRAVAEGLLVNLNLPFNEVVAVYVWAEYP